LRILVKKKFFLSIGGFWGQAFALVLGFLTYIGQLNLSTTDQYKPAAAAGRRKDKDER
jgi:hypothetical protein